MSVDNHQFGADFAARFVQALGALRQSRGRISRKELAELVSVSEGAIRNYEAGAIPQADVAVRIAKALEVSLEWLLTGNTGNSFFSPKDHELALVQRLDVRASAGPGAVVEAENELDRVTFDVRWLRNLGVAPHAARLISVEGDSMAPLILHGDLLMVDTATTAIGREGIYVLLVNGHLLVKQAAIGARGAVTIKSLNTAYADRTETYEPAEAATLAVQGKVVWYGRAIG